MGSDSAAPATAPPSPAWPTRQLMRVNRLMMGAGMLALLGASAILAAAVFLRYFLHTPTDWQDEVAVFLLIGMTFLCAGSVQEQRGHIGIDVLVGRLPVPLERLRRLLGDAAALAFCSYFAWKCLALLREAVSEGQTTASAWAPPLAIPYGLMTAGTVLLAANLAVQLLEGLRSAWTGRRRSTR